MEITNSLIERFFANECNEEEFDAVMAWFREHPEMAAKKMGLEEWAATDAASVSRPEHAAEVLQELKARFFPRRVRLMYWPAVAASLLLVAGGWMLLRKTGHRTEVVATAAPLERSASAEHWTSQTNNTSKIENIRLPDGSQVKLYAHASLRYSDSFGVVKRDSWLEGEAEFEVKKDKAHPFTVYNRSLATTVLGTVFTVNNESVKLFSGRVVVRAKGAKDIYLTPGEQLIYDDRRMVATVSRFEKLATDVAGNVNMGEDLVFNNSPLKKVFEQLSIQYHKKFNFRSRDLAGLNFTGNIARTDSLDVFLRLLAGMNNLDIREQDSGYIVSRHRE